MDLSNIEEILDTKLHLFQFDGEEYFGGFIQMPSVKSNRYKGADVEERLRQLITTAPLRPVLGTYELAESYIISGQPKPEKWCVVRSEGNYHMWYEEGELKTYDVGNWQVHWEIDTKAFVVLKVFPGSLTNTMMLHAQDQC